MEEKKKELFGKTLSKFRKRAGITQTELAQLIDMSPSHLSKIEQGTRNPIRKSNLKKIIAVLGLNEKDAKEIFSAAGYSLPPLQNHFAYSYPSGKYIAFDLPVYSKGQTAQDNPAINLLIETFNDSSLSETEKKEIENKIVSFLSWLKEEIRKTKLS